MRILVTLTFLLAFFLTKAAHAAWPAPNYIPDSHYYLISDQDAIQSSLLKLGPVPAEALFWWATTLGLAGAKVYGTFAAGGIATGLGASALIFPKLPLVVLGKMAGRLMIESNIKEAKVMRSLARQIPNIKDAFTLKGNEFDIHPLYVGGLKNKMLSVLVSDGPAQTTSIQLPDSTGKITNKTLLPIPTPDLLKLQISITNKQGSTHPVVWITSLQEILDKTPIPEEIQKEWYWHAQKESQNILIDADQKREQISIQLKVLLDTKNAETVTAESLAESRVIDLGTIAQGHEAEALLGLTSSAKIKNFFSAPRPDQIELPASKPFRSNKVDFRDRPSFLGVCWQILFPSH